MRRERATQRDASGAESEPEGAAAAPGVHAFDSSRRATEDAKTVSNSAEASVSWTGRGAAEAVDRPLPRSAGFSTEEEIVRA
ncbi:MAG TPA: hypothetical protein VE842_19940 [Pyrinomonadaceae bacterium]|nr:hypothetical protein [Pyrinomonadaceae bacterium]